MPSIGFSHGLVSIWVTIAYFIGRSIRHLLRDVPAIPHVEIVKGDFHDFILSADECVQETVDGARVLFREVRGHKRASLRTVQTAEHVTGATCNTR